MLLTWNETWWVYLSVFLAGLYPTLNEQLKNIRRMKSAHGSDRLGANNPDVTDDLSGFKVHREYISWDAVTLLRDFYQTGQVGLTCFIKRDIFVSIVVFYLYKRSEFQ